MSRLPCPATLRQGDFVETLDAPGEPTDVIWIGLSLHHLHATAKLDAMRSARQALDRNGVLLVYENASPDGEDRDEWHRRWDLQEPDWTELTKAEWGRITAHVHGHDIPETLSGWRTLGAEAGFAEMRELYVCPTNLFRLFAFET